MSTEMTVLQAAAAQVQRELLVRNGTILQFAQMVAVQGVNDENTYKLVGEALRRIKTELGVAEDERKRVTAPLNEAKRNTDELFRRLREPYEDAETTLKTALLGYQAKQAEERARVAAELMAAAGDVPKIMALATQAQQTVPPVLAGVQNRTVKKWRVVDEAAVPREVMVIDTYKVNECMKAGLAIPGIEYYEEQIIAARKS